MSLTGTSATVMRTLGLTSLVLRGQSLIWWSGEAQMKHKWSLHLLSHSASVGLRRGALCALAEVELVGDDFPTGDALGFWVVLKVANRSFLSLYAAYI